jgi:hypothetical protein
MDSVINLLPTESVKFQAGTGDWYSATSVLSNTFENVRAESDSASMRIYHAGLLGASAQVAISEIPTEYHNWPIRGFAWVNPQTTGIITIYLTYVSGGALTTVSSLSQAIAGQWTLLSVQHETIPHDTSVLLMGIVAEEVVSGESLYVSRPAIISPRAAVQSVAGGEVWLGLPEYLQATDKNQTDPDVPLFRFIETLFNLANSIDLIWQDFRWIPPEDNGRVIEESGLVSPNSALAPALVWMSQVIGSTLIDPTSPYTPWLFLDGDKNPLTSLTPTWALFVDALDKAPDDGNLSWEEIQNYNPALFDLTTAFRAQVNGAFYGYKAGTTQSIINAAKTATNVSNVTVIPNYLSDPFHIGVGIDASGDIVEVENILAPTTPAGYEITVFSV